LINLVVSYIDRIRIVYGYRCYHKRRACHLDHRKLKHQKAKEKYASLPAAKKQSLMLRVGIATIGRRPIEQLLTPV